MQKELRVRYKIPDGIDTELDKAITKAVRSFGFSGSGSGIDLLNGERDLVFEDRRKAEGGRG